MDLEDMVKVEVVLFVEVDSVEVLLEAREAVDVMEVSKAMED